MRCSYQRDFARLLSSVKYLPWGVSIDVWLMFLAAIMDKGFWEYFECGVHVSFGDQKEVLPDSEDECERQRSNLFFGCLSAANGLRNAFVLVQISRFQQIIGVYTLQAPTESAKVRWPLWAYHNKPQLGHNWTDAYSIGPILVLFWFILACLHGHGPDCKNGSRWWTGWILRQCLKLCAWQI